MRVPTAYQIKRFKWQLCMLDSTTSTLWYQALNQLCRWQNNCCLLSCCLALCCQVAEDEHLKEHYSPATAAEVQRWAVAVTKPRSRDDLRKQHAATAVAAIQFICRHEPDPGGLVGRANVHST
jgi:hypothetical protein